jgi:hypothetical protein
LIVERMGEGHVSGASSIPVITCARASPFLDRNQKHKGA